MGVYLSTPNTEKISTDQECSNFTYGASSMQGWRMSQEDAHNCIPSFDGSNTAFFAVYDGHGGAEVAQYCAEHFPDYLKTLDKFKNKEIGAALEEAFLGFDSHLLTEEVQKALKVSAGLDDIVEDEEEKVRQKNEAEMLRQEAEMPIEELMAQYEGAGMPEEIKNLRKKKQINSPMIRAKKQYFGQGDEKDEDLKDNVPLEGSVIPLRATANIQEKLANGHAENENNLNREKEQSDFLQKAQGGSAASSASDIRKMECDSVIKTDEESIPTSTQRVESSEACSSSVLLSSSSSSSRSGGQSVQNASVSSTNNKQEAVVSKCEVEESSEADSTSQEMETAQRGSSSQKLEIDESPSSTRATDSNVGGSAGSAHTDHISNGDSGGSGQSKETSPLGGKKQCKSRHVEDIDSGEEDLDDEDSEDEDVEFNSDEEEEDESDDSEESEEEEEEDDDLCYPTTNDQNNDEPGYCSGCTSVVAVIRDKEVVVANAGDSRCILCRDGKALDLSFDHKPEDDIERNRIVAAGGKVTSDGRVNGGLNLSRAIGDHFYKRNKDKDAREQMITALPDLQSATLQETDQFMVLACDGIWNYMTSQEVVDFVSERLKDPEKKKKPSVICEEIFDYCLAPNTLGDGTGCDNMTCMIITFDQMWNNNQNKRAAEQPDGQLDGQPEKRAKVEQT
ncbi:probable protein phosphatase CG10417 [Mizuhopecten yessoensis]|uniref:protein-serine/threonine phosphatase n=1 Tax=Mizuhopecten yessoensis TaxID=6573 RepID=A0A210R3C5_MIZYE|nr:probable protein phosphatase CG10417 [Mizuhopecten yessoensis]XP_021366225.1 probable protein phosphatase CG10417 [Mizuhopecten yessoensis]OWF55553.1 Phosphatase-like protein [Mizuhopecten yessoensis]